MYLSNRMAALGLIVAIYCAVLLAILATLSVLLESLVSSLRSCSQRMWITHTHIGCTLYTASLEKWMVLHYNLIDRSCVILLACIFL